MGKDTQVRKQLNVELVGLFDGLGFGLTIGFIVQLFVLSLVTSIDISPNTKKQRGCRIATRWLIIFDQLTVNYYI